MIKVAGSGYVLNVVAIDGSGFAVASGSTRSFSVGIGPIFKLQFVVAISAAFGGEVFKPFPRVAVVDRGGNIAVGVTGIACTPSISQSPTNVQTLNSSVLASALFESGIATFTQVLIRSVGYPYQISFNISSTAVRQLASNIFVRTINSDKNELVIAVRC